MSRETFVKLAALNVAAWFILLMFAVVSDTCSPHTNIAVKSATKSNHR